MNKLETTPEVAERHVDAMVIRRHCRRAEDRGMALAVHAGLQMVRDHGPDTVPVQPPYLPMDADGDPLGHALADQCQHRSAASCADTSAHPRSLLPVLVVLLAIASLALIARR